MTRKILNTLRLFDILIMNECRNFSSERKMHVESFAFWYHTRNEDSQASNEDSPAPTKDISAVLNFNLWVQCGWKCSPLLDIGFKIKNLQVADELYFFLPLPISEEQKTAYLEDLGCKFMQTELVDAVFNESYATTIAANSKTIDVENISDPSDKFKIYQLDISHDIELDQFADGTILKIKTDKIIKAKTTVSNDSTYYLRFRIKNKELPFLIHNYSSPAKALQSMFNTTYMIDFRYHNVRSLDKTLIEKFSEKGNSPINVTSLHFLLMTKAYVDVSNSDFKSVRKIEQDVWKSYVDGQDTNDLVAYHYAHKAKSTSSKEEPITEHESAYISSSEFFAKFRVEKSVIKLYVVVTISIGIIGSIVGSVLFEACKWIIKNLF